MTVGVDYIKVHPNLGSIVIRVVRTLPGGITLVADDGVPRVSSAYVVLSHSCYVQHST
jgi:hypothetical protein